jgi:hypothetical protein
MLTSREEVFQEGLDYGDLEAIILPGLRPVADVTGGKFDLPEAGEFADLAVEGSASRATLESAIAGVGCIVLPGHPYVPFAGTGFLVGKDLVMTNRHVAEVFGYGLGRKGIGLSGDYEVSVNPLREKPDDSSATYPVKRVVMIHPYWDMAILEVPDLPMKPLRLGSYDVAEGRRRVAVLGYPAFDPRNPAEVQAKVFHNRYSVKRLSPGYVTQRMEVTSFGRKVSAVRHDASTLGGNSGSALIDVTSGHVIGLHFGGRYKDGNWAVPMAELARDKRVIDAGVDFVEPRPDDGIPWKQVWDEVENESIAVPGGVALKPTSDPGTVRVTVPIEITIRVGQATTATVEWVGKVPFERPSD